MPTASPPAGKSLSADQQQAAALLIGTAVGDALGLPYEGLSTRRARRRFGAAPLHHRLFFGYGMCSDDTEHACMTAEAIVRSGGNPDAFARSLAWSLRWWLLLIPAGIGLATLKSILKLWCGFPPGKSGVWSAGNGPAMRAPVIGVYTAQEPDARVALVRASTRLTHRDPKAFQGALAIANAAAYFATCDRFDLAACTHCIVEGIDDTELLTQVMRVQAMVATRASAEEFAKAFSFSKGVSGYMYHTVPAVLFCAMRFPDDFRAAVESVILFGGDTDSTAALVGALVGVHLGEEAVPAEWKSHLKEWPRTPGWIRGLASDLALSKTARRRRKRSVVFALALVIRNIPFAVVILAHGFRRLLPPY